ncbi:MAG: hypothetical protein IJ305_06730 [Oscillospiraceae bacterium]|nr:hypothetical protein [Oscillospiraceae bacterium]
MLMTLSVLGIIGGLLCAVADMLWDFKGADNKKLGAKGLIYSKWSEMPDWRFISSAILSMIAIPMYCLGLFSLAGQFYEHSKGLAITLAVLAYMGAVCGFLTHFCACIKPLIYKAVDLDTEVTERIIQRMRKAAAIPFYIPFAVFCFVVLIILIIAMANGFLTISPLWLLITPLPVQVFAAVLKKLNNRIFFDFPYCCGIALGMSGYSVIALLNLI